MADISTWQSDYVELCLRARARQYWPELGFVDPAAQLIAERLGFGGGRERGHGRNERLALKRSRWFDRRCEHFFSRYPNALCIELGAGLSTRFHRLSATADWPRFRWLEVDTPEQIERKSVLLPAIDNYQLMASEITSVEWLASWQGEPLILLVEQLLMHMNPSDVQKLFQNIASRAVELRDEHGRPLAIEIVFDYLSPWNLYGQKIVALFGQGAVGLSSGLTSAARIVEINSAYSVLVEESLNEYTSMWKRHLDIFYRWLTGGKYLEACAAVTWDCSARPA